MGGGIAQHPAGGQFHQGLRTGGQHPGDGHVLRSAQIDARGAQDHGIGQHRQRAGAHAQGHAAPRDGVAQGERSAADDQAGLGARGDLLRAQAAPAVQVDPTRGGRGQRQLIGADFNVAAAVVRSDAGAGCQRDGLARTCGAQQHGFGVGAGVQDAAASGQADIAAGAGHAAQGHIAAGGQGQVALDRQRATVLQQVACGHAQVQGPGTEPARQGQMTRALRPTGPGHCLQSGQAGGAARTGGHDMDGRFVDRCFIGLDRSHRARINGQCTAGRADAPRLDRQGPCAHGDIGGAVGRAIQQVTGGGNRDGAIASHQS